MSRIPRRHSGPATRPRIAASTVALPIQRARVRAYGTSSPTELLRGESKVRNHPGCGVRARDRYKAQAGCIRSPRHAQHTTGRGRMRPPAIGSTSSILAAAFVLVAAATVGCSSHHKRKPPAEVCAQEPAVAYSTDCTVTLSYQVFSEDLLTNPPARPLAKRTCAPETVSAGVLRLTSTSMRASIGRESPVVRHGRLR